MELILLLLMLLKNADFKPKQPIEINELISYAEMMKKPKKVRVTCYLPTGNHMANGEYPFVGACAGRKEDIGKVAALYDLDMNFIGYLEICDCGGAKSLKNGTSIDVFQPTIADARAFIKKYGDYGYIFLIDAVG